MQDQIINEAVKLYREHYPGKPTYCVVAPGRVNLIGEHTDYNEGFVCPLGINLATCIVGIKGEGNLCTVTSSACGRGNVTQFRGNSSLSPKKTVKWFHYIQGVVAQYLKEFNLQEISFQIAIYSTVPLGGGLSSSASLEIAVASFIEAAYGLAVDPIKRAELCQAAEHEFAHVPCGIMDQYISSCAQEDHALLIDCRDNKSELVPLVDPNVAIVICNSNKKHELTGSEYDNRVQACKSVVAAITEKYPEVKALRDCTISMLDEVKESISDVDYRRARHVINEDERTQNCVEALKNNDYVKAGQYLYESHESLKTDYEVSTPELDTLVDIAKNVEGVFGSRMTGGGFGGCTVTLVQAEAVETLKETLQREYKEKTGIDCTIFVTRPCQGAHVVELHEEPKAEVVVSRCPMHRLMNWVQSSLFNKNVLLVSGVALSCFLFMKYYKKH